MGRLRFGRFASISAALLALLMFSPAFTRAFWMARLVVAEFPFLIAIPALGGLLALRTIPSQRWYQALAVVSLLASLAPLVVFVPAYAAHHRTFSLMEYLTWGPRHPPITQQTDLSLEPSLPTLKLDFYRGLGEGPRPLLVLVHGGSFSGGDKGENRTASEIFAAAGYSVADVQYRLAPKFVFPTAVQDVKCLVGRLREKASTFGIDPERVAYLGRSAGAAIAAVAAYSAGDPRLPSLCDAPDLPVSAMVSLYGPLDLDWGWRIRVYPDPITGYKALERYIGGTPATKPDDYRMASAVSWVGPATPPSLLINGTRDTLVSPYHSQLLAEACARKGLQAPRRLLIPFAEHGFDYHPGGLGEQLARAEILEFLADALKPPPTPQLTHQP
ncbi:MAG: alpha/beta hydrolase [Vicinamibacteria bacterium]